MSGLLPDEVRAQIQEQVDLSLTTTFWPVERTETTTPQGQDETFSDGTSFLGRINKKTLTKVGVGGALVVQTELHLLTPLSIVLDENVQVRDALYYYEVIRDVSTDPNIEFVNDYLVQRLGE